MKKHEPKTREEVAPGVLTGDCSRFPLVVPTTMYFDDQVRTFNYGKALMDFYSGPGEFSSFTESQWTGKVEL